MARGAEGKLRRRNRRKEEAGKDLSMDLIGDDDDNVDDVNGTMEVTDEIPLPLGLQAVADEERRSAAAAVTTDDMPRKNKKKTSKPNALPKAPSASKRDGIKGMPLILLILLTGTTLLPVFIYAGDYLSAFMAHNHVLGSLGFRLGIGAVPRKRVVSFYEKHVPEKVSEVPTILAKHYGDYPKLIKKLERKYQDYGYFVGWEDDEAPLRLALEQVRDLYHTWITRYWNKYAPQVLKTAMRNVRYNVTFLYKRGRRLWKKHVWPWLEPVVGVPKGAERQKRQDAADARKAQQEQQRRRRNSAGTRRRSAAFRDENEETDEHI